MAGLGGDVGGGLGGAAGGLLVLAGAGGKGGDRERKQALNVWKKLQLSSFDMRALSPPELQVFSTAFPELFQEVVAGSPPEIADSPEVRRVSIQNLQRLNQVAQEGLPTMERLAAEQAQRRVAQASGRAQEQVLRDLAERGRLGAGDELSARLAAQQQSQNLAAIQGSDLAQQAIANRVGATGQAAQLAEGIRAQDIGRRATQESLMARYNQMASELGTQRAMANAQARERAQMYNVGVKQHVGEQNEQAKYQAALENLQRQNALRGASFGQSLAKTQGVSNALTDMANWKDQIRMNREKALVQTGQGIGQIGGSFI